ncbi:hypothetical protein DFH06DRAFT_1388301 [Mycena polygramma]|nr:hypothetical protein DFH06DRAFT_1388301 [Mycena polygramma]
MPVKFSRRPYDSFAKQIQACRATSSPTSNPESLVAFLDKLAHSGQALSLDYENLLDHVRIYSTYRPPDLENLRVECIKFFENVLATSRACNQYLACCYRAFDPTVEIKGLPHDAEPESAFRNLSERHKKLGKSISRMHSCWIKAERMIMKELQDRLQIPLGFEWLLRVEWILGFHHAQAQLLAFRDELPTLVSQARLHCAIFSRQCESLHILIKQVESVRVGAPDAVMSQNVALEIVADARWFDRVLFVFTQYKMGLESFSGTTPLFPHPLELY